jgi:cellulose synthase/poly-beta-1,6-N-acetylglucosamine synthase-like glycosyltransferase/peptidoglycan/xylan/chitin deacetylase (PgdA/CDA1 family)/spore germination protein YaaH
VSPSDLPHIFIDPSGQRWRRVRRIALGFGVISSLLALGLVISIVIPPLLPSMREAQRTVRGATRNGFTSSRSERERLSARRRLLAALAIHPAPRAEHPERLTIPRGRRTEARRAVAPAAPNPVRPPLVVGFNVKWDDNSFAAYRAHASELDWVVSEWIFVAPRGDSLRLDLDPRILFANSLLPPESRPRIFAMVSNFDSQSGVFATADLRRLLTHPVARRKAIAQLTAVAERYGLAGITIDFEEVPDDLVHDWVAFLRDLRTAMAPAKRLVTTTIAASVDTSTAREVAAPCDYVFVMLYDEHFGRGDPGPVASQAWYDERASALTPAVGAKKAILALGAFGYDWNDAGGRLSGHAVTYQEMISKVRAANAVVRFDSTALNPYAAWDDPDSTSHVAWFLDAATGWNHLTTVARLKAAGAALWRLGAEDPSLWALLDRDPTPPSPSEINDIPAGYQVEFEGNGELLRMRSPPTAGTRTLRLDAPRGLVVAESLTVLPSPWVIQRFGDSEGKVALTFDDGPDARWTPDILDTLKSRGVPATFFIVGRDADDRPGIVRRIYREGHEIGNHTYTHRNLSLTAPWVGHLELVATERLIETILGRRTVLFRPPYFGDAEPTTADELDPVAMATRLGYVTVGVRIDSEDWRLKDPALIIGQTMAKRRSGNNIVLMHDGGGDRSATVAALGPIIDSLKARGDTLVLASTLAGVSRDDAMPALPRRSTLERSVDMLAFGAIGAADWGLYWLFFVAVILGVGRLAFILALAVIQRVRHGAPRATDFAPPVTVIVPAYREAKVIERTVHSLLAQDYAGPLDVVVVDDGSPDDTYAVARHAFDGNPRVIVLTKPNGGKASALNHGIARASADIVICLDADTLFEPRTVAELVAPLADPKVGAVAGNAKVGNRLNLVTRWQALEYVTSQNLDRRAFALLDCITVVPGAVGAWRKDVVLAVGGFRGETLAEDQDLTISVHKAGYSVGYAQRAIAWTEAPDSLGGLARQRFRWSFGTLQCAWKHRDALLNPRFGTLGMVALPNTWLFQLILTALSPLADLLFVYGLVSVWMTWQSFGESYALVDLYQILIFYAVFLVTDWLGAVIAFLMEPDEEYSLTWLIVLQRFAYRQVMYWVVLRSFFAAVRGRTVGWGSLERKATVGATR